MSLTLKEINKSYGRRHNRNTVLDGLDLNLQDGGVVAILGENGSGKTTLLKCILGLSIPNHGEILWDGQPVNHLIGQGLVGYVPENLLFPAMVSLEEYMIDLASLRGIKSLQDTIYPEVLEDLFLVGQENRPLPHLSKGNKKKAGFIQAICHKPALLVLDEPTDGLDPVSREKMLEYIRSLGDSGSLVLMSSHQMGDVLASANRVLILANGRIIANEKLSELQGGLENWYREVIRNQKGDLVHAQSV